VFSCLLFWNFFFKKNVPEALHYIDYVNHLRPVDGAKHVNLASPYDTSVSRPRNIVISEDEDEDGDKLYKYVSIKKMMRLFYANKISLLVLLQGVAYHYANRKFVLVPDVAIHSFAIQKGFDSLYFSRSSGTFYWLTRIGPSFKFRFNGWYEFIRAVAQKYPVYMLGFSPLGVTCTPIHTHFNKSVWDELIYVFNNKQIRERFLPCCGDLKSIPVFRCTRIPDQTDRAAKLAAISSSAQEE
jgi:hypothetical protein